MDHSSARSSRSIDRGLNCCRVVGDSITFRSIGQGIKNSTSGLEANVSYPILAVESFDVAGLAILDALIRLGCGKD
jgi:hypothetical protein